MDFSFIEDEETRAKAIDAHQAALKSATEDVDSKVEEAIQGLKTKNDELLSEKKKIQSSLEAYKDIKDPEKALEALQFIEQSEEAQMIRDGKFDELLDKRTSQMKLDHDNAIVELTEKYEDTSKEANHYKHMYETKIMDDAMREVAIKAGVRTEAVPDVLLRSKEIFSLGKDGSIESRNQEGKLNKNEDGVVVTPTVWLESLKESSPHYWPQSEGVGARGGNITGDADLTEKLAEASRNNDMAAYRKIRAKMKGVE